MNRSKSPAAYASIAAGTFLFSGIDESRIASLLSNTEGVCVEHCVRGQKIRSSEGAPPALCIVLEGRAAVEKQKGDATLRISVLEKGEATVTRDGATLATNIDAMINKQPKDGARYEYRYSFDREIFEDEGIYTIDIKSKDIADNINEYSKDNDIYKLCVDRTPPTISISGIKAGGSYKDGGIQVNVDDSMKLEQYVVMSNDEVLYSSTEDEPIKNSAAVRLPSGIKQTVTVEAVDAAGNTNSEVIENVTVSESFFVRLFSNTLVKIMFAIILLGIIGVIVYRIIRKRKEY